MQEGDDEDATVHEEEEGGRGRGRGGRGGRGSALALQRASSPLPRARRVPLSEAQLSHLRSHESALLATLAEQDVADSALCSHLRQWIRDIQDPRGHFLARMHTLARALVERHVLYARVKAVRLRRTAFRGGCLTGALLLLAVLLQHSAALLAGAAGVAHLSGAWGPATGGGGTGAPGGARAACSSFTSYFSPSCYVRAAATATLHWGIAAAAVALCYLLLSVAGAQLHASTKLRDRASQMRALEDALVAHFEEAALAALVEFAGPRLADVYDTLLNLPPEQRAWVTHIYSEGGQGFMPLRDLLFLRMEAVLLANPDVVTLLGTRFDSTLVEDLTQRAAEEYFSAVREYTRCTDRLGEAQVAQLRQALSSGLLSAVGGTVQGVGRLASAAAAGGQGLL